ncbi:hypothetical protein SARC_09497 [Sphaeroforma arctica JP610]|uniref:Uncharacterized protein n=1 Tax=Sphaeroforma arctica JP610 TaxID=667725 RepID=A0A0L0FNK1_9EUKA|nr:hypothetical protein SARC_09497 [Sphaeroforma arctica JP610]KNC78051.1 hypothetical protein SARC_09497 [Sphaeroforma arctica JP610]|eukprot:XP_014151953.1 hypothetical protein SARC_09497 [Sphaeroforma arctica JP610]
MAKLDTLTEAELSAHPDDVFEILDLLGEGSHRNMHVYTYGIQHRYNNKEVHIKTLARPEMSTQTQTQTRTQTHAEAYIDTN